MLFRRLSAFVLLASVDNGLLVREGGWRGEARGGQRQGEDHGRGRRVAAVGEGWRGGGLAAAESRVGGAVAA